MLFTSCGRSNNGPENSRRFISELSFGKLKSYEQYCPSDIGFGIIEEDAGVDHFRFL